MSKKNKNKNRFVSPANTGENRPAETRNETATVNAQEKAQDIMKTEFRNLGIVVFFILALLIGIYIYDQQTHILQSITRQLFNYINK